jgi:hypothetical protein
MDKPSKDEAGLITYFARTLGALGGQVTRQTYGEDHLREIGARGGNATYERHGAAYYKKLSRRAVAARRAMAGVQEGI